MAVYTVNDSDYPKQMICVKDCEMKGSRTNVRNKKTI